MVLASGFPWNVTKNDVRAFFNGLNILHGSDGIFITKDVAMKAYVQFASPTDHRQALAKNFKKMYSRTIHGN